jgi:hypothetical protein
LPAEEAPPAAAGRLEEPLVLDPTPISDIVAVRLVDFFPSLSSGGQIGRYGQPGTPFSNEGTLGLSSEHAGYLGAEFMVRLHQDHRIRIDYFQSDRLGRANLTSNLTFGGAVLCPVAGSNCFTSSPGIAAESEWRIFGGTYAWDVLHHRNYSLSVLAGVHIAQTVSTIQGLTTNGADPVATVRFSSSIVLPSVGVEGMWAFGSSHRWSMTARGQALNSQLNGHLESLHQIHADLQYRVTPNVSTGIGYSSIAVNNGLPGNTPGDLYLKAKGLETFIRASF